MADVFISYAREDHNVAHQLAYAFQLEDWTCWWDPQLKLGEDFRPVVAERIDDAAAVIVVWSPAARASTWVKWEVERARQSAKKLVELELGAPEGLSDDVISDTLVITGRPYLPPMRDTLLARVAQAGNLRRRSDGWNSCLRATAWRNRQPRRPIIAWEIVEPGTDHARVVRRERWFGTASVEYGTTIGNAWFFGPEDKRVAIGWLTVTEPEHDVQLPKPNRSAERQAQRESFTTPFSFEARLTEMFDEIAFPGGGVDLAADR